MLFVACSFDESQEYCTYDNPEYSQNELIGYSLMLVQVQVLGDEWTKQLWSY